MVLFLAFGHELMYKLRWREDRPQEVDNVTTRQKGQRKKAANSAQAQKIKVQKEEEKGQEIVVRRGQTLQRTATTSAWSWHQEFTLEWSETLITRKK